MIQKLAIYLASAQANCNQGTPCDTGLPQVGANQITNILQYVFGVIGALALIIILVSAIQFITASGDPQGINKARNTLIYAIIGLVIAISAETIVTFVLKNI